MGKFSLTCFGVGDGWPCANRNHSGFLYRFGRTSLLVDCGDGFSRPFKAAGLSYDTIDRIVISHLHADHFAGLFMLMQGFWLEGRKKALPVHLPADGVKPLGQMLNAAMLFPELLKFRLQLHALQAGRAAGGGGVRVTPFTTSHLDRLKKSFQKKHPLRFGAFCFLIEAGKLRIGHSADIGSPEDLEPLLKKPLDLLVCELAHFPAETLFRYLAGRDVKRVVFVHLGRRYWENLKATRVLASKMLPGVRFSFATDGQEFSF
jgi:phosphoribosyl 1,2-cyclic phosphodiesterase